MYAQTAPQGIQPPADATSTTPSRAAPSRKTLQTRPPVQRALIRSWEYSRPVRITVLAIRTLVAMWLFVLSGLLVSHGYAAAYALVPTAVAVFAFGLWVFKTAEKGWPAAGA
jgi:hypothetical protein